MDYLKGIDPKKIRAFREKAVRYNSDCGRSELPWRQTQDPWRILLAEMLLRKTTAAQAEAVYPRLSDLDPAEIGSIASNELAEILRPLGIHRERARLLKLVAKAVAHSSAEDLSDWKYLTSLPGVGWYTASMVLAIAFGEKRAGLDRNMIRVLGRVFGISSEKDRPHTDRDLWAAAQALVPSEDPKQFNWGILDISAQFCRPRKPKCAGCPLNEICDYRKAHDETGKW